MKPYYQDEWVTIYLGDCRLILPELPKVDLVLTDPPYPDQHPEYGECNLLFLDIIGCRQLVFWSAKVEFPLDYTATHIWDKKIGTASQYERLFERNGQHHWKVYSYTSPINSCRARFSGDVITGHPSQKPQKFIGKLISEYSIVNDLILDPFLGSGTTAYCAKKLNRKCIGIEIEEKYCEIAAKRCSQSVMTLNV